MAEETHCALVLNDGNVYHGYSFGCNENGSGEIGKYTASKTAIVALLRKILILMCVVL